MRILVRSITPKRKFDFRHFEQEIRAEMQDFAENPIIRDLKSPTATWNHSVGFSSRVTATPSMVAIDVYTDDDIYNWVSAGTRPTARTARNGEFMYFRPGYVASTRPGRLSSRQARRTGPVVRARVVVQSIEPRYFYETVGNINRLDFQRRVENALRRAARKQVSDMSPSVKE